MASLKAVHDEPDKVPSKEASQEPHPTFGPHPNTQVADFDFKKEIEHLAFKLNLGDVHLDKEHHTKSINLIYSRAHSGLCEKKAKKKKKKKKKEHLPILKKHSQNKKSTY